MTRERVREWFARRREQSDQLAASRQAPKNRNGPIDERVGFDEDAQSDIDTRIDVGSGDEPPSSDEDASMPPRQSGARFGKIAAAISCALFLIAVIVGVWGARSFLDGFPLRLDDTFESVDQRTGETACTWRVEATLRNDSDRTITVTHFTTVLDKRRARARDMFLPTIAPGETAVAVGNWKLANTNQGSCPDPSEISHTDLVIGFSHASSDSVQGRTTRTVSRGF